MSKPPTLKKDKEIESIDEIKELEYNENSEKKKKSIYKEEIGYATFSHTEKMREL